MEPLGQWASPHSIVTVLQPPCLIIFQADGDTNEYDDDDDDDVIGVFDNDYDDEARIP